MNRYIIYVQRTLAVLCVGMFFVMPAARAALAIDETGSFFVQPSFDALGRNEEKARFVKESKRAYWYADVSFWDTLNRFEKPVIEEALDEVAQEFDDVIFPKLTTFYGNPWIPGIDNDPKIYVLFTPMPDTVGGYTNRDDEFERTEILDSNQKELIYLNSEHLSSFRLPSLLAHEFQHLITFNQKDRLQQRIDTAWLNELRSEYAPRAAGYDREYRPDANLAIRIAQFLQSPVDALTQWDGAPGDYASVSLFAHYLAQRISPEVIAETTVNDASGVASINMALEALDRPARFVDLFVDWTLALIINDRTVGDGRYGYNDNFITIKRPVDHNFTRLSALAQSVEIMATDTLDPTSSKLYEFASDDKQLFQVELTTKTSNAPLRIVAIEYLENDGGIRVTTIPLNDDTAVGTFNPKGVDRFQLAVMNTTDKQQKAGFTIRATTIESTIPEITTITPTEGQVLEPITLTISGSQFDPESTIEVSNAAIDSVNVESSSTIKVTITPQQAGDLTITVVNPNNIRSVAPQKIHIPELPTFPEGTLIQAIGDDTIYIVKGRFIRAIDGATISLYPHLSIRGATFVTPNERDGLQLSGLIRADGTEEVYEIDDTGKRHWLDMTPGAFANSGRSWDAVYVINHAELDRIPIGQPITS
ncbi:MAG: hypothetical protein A2666_04955 [Parcubacteria group bacterium RIFCSPHIGHO2_01_FULL_47_10b]|nr:MAG: hypothetical protein A2666_04955 [Parcubacteria group bacterium RIFCSPHIGHO2_01_FULL_47_10b]